MADGHVLCLRAYDRHNCRAWVFPNLLNSRPQVSITTVEEALLLKRLRPHLILRSRQKKAGGYSGCFITSTYFLENGEKQPQWLFEESFIDQNHSVAVCKLVSSAASKTSFEKLL